MAKKAKTSNRTTSKKKPGRSTKGKSQTANNGEVQAESNDGPNVNKSAEIRAAYKALGKKARPKEVVAALAEKGVTVSPAQVSMVRFNMKAKKAARKAAASVEVAAPKQSRTKAKSSGDISGVELIEAKRLADQLGGIERLQQALDLLAQLA